MATQTESKEKLQSTASQSIPVTVDNFKRTETDMYFSVSAIKEGALGKFFNRRELFSVDQQSVVRGNRDTLYSSGVFDLDAGPVTITLPDAGKRFMSMPIWDSVSQKKVRDALIQLSQTIPDFEGGFGKKNEVDPVRHLIATAAGWGGNPDKDARYLNVTPKKNDGKTIYRLTVKDVPVDAFWSVTVCNKEGYFEKNSLNAYSINNISAKKEADGSVIIQFGGCDGKIANCLPIVEGWNYTVRLYRPRPEILNGKWKFPEPQSTV